MRRVGNTGTKPIYQVGELVLDINRHEVALAGVSVELTPTEFDILSILI